MSKRGGSELNHINWDQEDPGESAGVFQKAAASELKGRVIKKARRRNAGDDAGGGAPKNAFSSFSGFSAAKPSAEASFSFLSGDKKPEAPAFSFGSSVAEKKTEAAPTMFGSAKPGGFAFGSSTTEAAKPAAPAPAFGGFSFGAKAAEKKDEQPVKVSPLSPVNENKSADTASKPEAKTASFGDSGGFKFGSSDTGDKAEDKGGFSFGTGSKSTGSSSAFSTTSPGFSFGAAKTDAAPSASGGGFSFGDKTGKAAAEKPATTGGGFSFGSTSATEKPAATASSGFSFGAAKPSESPAEKPASTGFAFGSAKTTTESPSSAAKPASSLFSFGAKPAATTEASPKQEKSVGFAFGASAKPAESPKAKEQPPAFGGFAFGSKSTEKTESPKKPESKVEESVKETKKSTTEESKDGDQYSDEYLAHLKALNLQVTDWIERHVKDNPLVILSPVFQDYEKHLKDLSVKFPLHKTSSNKPVSNNQTNSIPEATSKPSAVDSESDKSNASKPFAFGSSAEKKSESSAAPFSFGANSETTSAPKPFSFGSSSTSSETKTESAPGGGFSFGSNLSKPGGGFSFGTTGGTAGGASMFANVKPPQAAEANKEEEEEEDQPPKVEVKVVEESDALYSKKCKLFYKKDGNYCEKGVGMLHLKTADNGKTQMLVRADTNLGNILLNIMLNADIPTTRVGKNNVMFVCVPNPPIDPKATTSEPTPMLIRVKTSEDADALKEKVDELKKK